MKLKATVYNSPIPTIGTFNNVFIEETRFLVKRTDRYFSITFEMYYLKDGHRIVLDTFDLAFAGMNDDPNNTNRTTVISIPNPDYASLVAGLPATVETPNPDYDPAVEGSEEFITIDNPAIAAIPLRINIPMLQYLYEHQGVWPEDYEMVDFGYPTFEDVLPNFDGGTLTSPELFLNNDFAKAWLLENVIMKGEKIGVQFEFVE